MPFLIKLGFISTYVLLSHWLKSKDGEFEISVKFDLKERRGRGRRWNSHDSQSE